MTPPRERFIDPAEVFSEEERPRVRPRLVTNADQNPDPDERTEHQVDQAHDRIDEDPSDYPRFPWRALDETAGRMAPSELWILAARTGNGKTLFLLNLFDNFVQDQRLPCFYIGLEQEPMEMRIKWACMVTGVPVAGALAGKWPDMWDDRRRSDAKARIREALSRQKSHEIRELARFCEARFINAALLRRWTTWAIEHGAMVVFIDHLNRIARDEHRTSFDGHSHVVTTAKELAVEHGIVMLAASQVGRPNGDPVQRFTPPALHELRGGGTSEEEANTVLMIYRPLKSGITGQQMKLVRQGLAEESTLYEEGLMAVRVAKHRLLGLQKEQTVILRVEHGRVLDRYSRSS